MCSIVFLIFKNKMYNTYLDLNRRIILNNVLKVTLDIVENVFFLPNEQLENRASRILSRPSGILF